MATQYTSLGIPYPQLPDSNDVPAAIKAAAEATDDLILATRAAVLWRGHALNADNNITPNTQVGLTLTEDHNQGGFVPGASSWIRAVPSDGVYRCRVVIQAKTSTASGYVRAEVRRNVTGSDMTTGTVIAQRDAPLSSIIWVSVEAEATLPLSAGDTIALATRTNASSAITVAGADYYRTFMEIERVGD